jgi:hypothetical protein
MMGERTGTFVTFKNVVFERETSGVLLFTSEAGRHEIPDWEIERVVLVDGDTGLTQM